MLTLWHAYGVRRILGFAYGYAGLAAAPPVPPAKVAKAAETPKPHDTARPRDTAKPDAKRHRRSADRDPVQRVAITEPSSVTPAPAEPGRLHVDARPWATVYLDGKSLGVTPIVGVSVSAGDHVIKAVSEDGQVRTMRLRVSPGGEVRRRVTW